MAKPSFLILATIFLGVITPSCLSDNILHSGKTLSPGEFLSYRSYVFIMQEDCNLVLYDVDKPIWATNTGGLSSGCHLSMQSDGNLVVYSPQNRPIWASDTGGQNDANYVLILQKDRNVVIYGPATLGHWNLHRNCWNSRISACGKYPTAGMIKLVTNK
uniref:Lectin n=1 Tax=Lycoris radiata TaxID=228395 RepID=Q6Y1R8_LYCRD|nr:lectin [Lycoris radiata]